MKVLLTGMTSQHTNPDTHKKRVNFAGLIRDAFRITEDEVYWQEPSVTWDDDYLKQFDAVIVGVAPLSSLGANRAYGALNVISRLWNSGRLTLLVDAPDCVKIETSAQAIIDHPESLVKEFFSHRKEYRLAREKQHFDRLYTGAFMLRTQLWRQTIFPRLPWQHAEDLVDQMRNTKFVQVTPLNLDSFLFSRYAADYNLTRHRWWAYEAGSAPGWLEKQQVCWTVDELPSTHRVPTNEMTLQQLRASRGTLIAPSKSGTWWTPRYAMSLSQGTPVFSDWRETKDLGEAWSVLPTGFEMMTDVEKAQLLTRQTMTFEMAAGNRRMALDNLYSALNLERKAETWMAG